MFAWPTTTMMMMKKLSGINFSKTKSILNFSLDDDEKFTSMNIRDDILKNTSKSIKLKFEK